MAWHWHLPLESGMHQLQQAQADLGLPETMEFAPRQSVDGKARRLLQAMAGVVAQGGRPRCGCMWELLAERIGVVACEQAS